MARAQARSEAQSLGPITPYEEAHVIRRFTPETEARMHDLARRHNDGLLSGEERRELDHLVEQASELMLENARALLRHRHPDCYEAALAEEQGLHHRDRKRTSAATQGGA
jgi:hypothetical protein